MCEPVGLVVMLHGDAARVEEDKDDHHPVEHLLNGVNTKFGVIFIIFGGEGYGAFYRVLKELSRCTDECILQIFCSVYLF